jgi:murein DD-endopeptidase MepM/ murein hydrolase activator NlpD
MHRRVIVVLAAAVFATGSCAASRRESVTPAEAAREIHDASPALAPSPTPVPPPAAAQPQDDSSEQDDGVVHIVQPGQTLWRIARAYDVPIETLARANNIDDPTRVDVGVPVFIPGARATIDVAPYPAPIPGRDAPVGVTGDMTEFLWPIRGGAFMRPFGEPRRHHTHAGVDIRGARGQDILAARDGIVAFCGRTSGGYGTMIILDHGDGVQTVYAHAQKLLVKAGDRVTRGSAIALVGRSGNATTEHCHFELRIENRPIDPMPHFAEVTQARK